MPELPDVELYVAALRPRVVGQVLQGVRIASPFLLRTVDPPVSAISGQRVRDVRRVGKRIALGLDNGVFVVVHLMIAGRFRWKEPAAALPGKIGLAAFDFPRGTLLLTEAGSRRRAALHVLAGEAALAALNPGGLEVLTADLASFREVLVRESHTLKRALTDPRLFSGIGNAYSDEILHAARLSPLKLTRSLTPTEVQRLHESVQGTLRSWVDRLQREAGDAFPQKVTAFRPGMAVHGRYGHPCPRCGTPVQRLVYAENEANYCPSCQTGGRLLADRALSRLLRDDWPRSLDDLEELKRARRVRGDVSGTTGPPRP